VGIALQTSYIVEKVKAKYTIILALIDARLKLFSAIKNIG
jgi:hypothetical protein